MRINILAALTVISLIVWAAQKTPLAFLSPNVTDFVGGLTLGLAIGTIVAWGANRA